MVASDMIHQLWAMRTPGRVVATSVAHRHVGTALRAARRRVLHRPFVIALALLMAGTCVSAAAVLSDADAKKVEGLKPMFLGLMTDLSLTSKRTDLSSGDQECLKSTIQELAQISQELASYEYLMTIEKDMTDFGENSPMREVVKFAIDKSNNVLSGGRRRLVEVSDQCTRFPVSFGKTQQALQFIDSTTGILNSIQPHL